MRDPQLITPPAIEPVTLAEAKVQARVDLDNEDDLITQMIVAARRRVEIDTRRVLITQTWDYFLDWFPWEGGGYLIRSIRQSGPSDPRWLPIAGWGILELWYPPIQSVTYLKYYDANDTLQTLATTEYDVSLGTPGRLQPAYNKVWPQTAQRLDAIQIRYVAGYGADATYVPATLKQAILLLVATWFKQREVVSDINLVEVPMAYKALVGAEALELA